MLGSMRARMTLAFSCCMVGFLLTTCLLLVYLMQRAAERHVQETLESAVAKIHHELPGTTFSEAELHEVETDLSQEHIALILLDAQGYVRDESRGAASFHKDVLRLRTNPRKSLRDSSQELSAWRTCVIPLGKYTVLIGLPWLQTQRALHEQALLLFALSVITVGAATLGAWLLVGWTLSPISRVSQQARAATADGGYMQLNAPSQDAEVVELIATLNDLLARQHEATRARGRFYAAASHELRTPLQALSGHLELALQRPRALEEYHAVVQEANGQTQRLTALTRALLQLYQLEGDPHPRQMPVDLAQICAETVQTFAPAIQAKRLQVEADIPTSLLVDAVPTHADIIVRNLLENAVRYATPDGSARIYLTKRSGIDPEEIARLEIWNRCEIVADRQFDKWLEPFYRPDTSRNAQTGGNGLGLALCQAIARANGWQLDLRQEGAFVVARVVFGLA